MNKKTIITLIILIIIAVAASLFSNKNPEVVTTVEENAPRNDTVTSEATTTEPTEPVVKSYSLAEVALHDKATDCWLVIDSKVIDATQFIAAGLHPNDKILNGCGKDATLMFKNIPKHQGPTPQEALKQYEIGILK